MHYIFVAFCVISLAFGQLMFKEVSNRMTNFMSLVFDFQTAKLFFASLVLYGVSTLFWIAALQKLPLSKAYPFMALGFFIVPIAAHFIFGERLTAAHLLGAGFIVGGILIISWA